MSHTTKVLVFIVSVLVLLLINASLLIHETKSGVRYSRWLTFVLPLGALYFVLFKSGSNEGQSESATGSSVMAESIQKEETESDILERELHNPEIEWQEISQWPSGPEESVVIDAESQVQPVSSQIEQLERLSKLRMEGRLTDDEFNALKAILLDRH